MGLYRNITETDRFLLRKVEEKEVNELLQEALKYDSSLMIEENTYRVKRAFFRKPIEVTRFTVLHEKPGIDGSAYHARYMLSASGNKEVVIAYLYGIINGSLHSSNKI